jgi:hypothetical protein
MTGTAIGTALGAPPKPVATLLSSAVKWKAFFKCEADNPKYLRHGDIVEASVRPTTAQSISAPSAPL